MSFHPTNVPPGRALASGFRSGACLLWLAACAVLACGNPLSLEPARDAVAQDRDSSEHQAGKLRRAAQRGDLEAVLVLLDAGADPDAQDEDGDTALYWAALNNHVQTAKALLAAIQAAGPEAVAKATAMDFALQGARAANSS